jgi:hypothetical protein
MGRFGWIEQSTMSTVVGMTLAVLIVVVATSTSCASSQPRLAGGVPSTRVASAPTTQPDATTTLAASNLTGALLNVGDLPRGSVVLDTGPPVNALHGYFPSQSCYGDDPALGLTPVAGVARQYQLTSSLFVLVDELYRYRGSDAEKLLSNIRAAYRACTPPSTAVQTTTTTTPSSTGCGCGPSPEPHFDLSMRPIPGFGVYGDESFAVQVGLGAYLVVIRVDDMVSVLSLNPVGSPTLMAGLESRTAANMRLLVASRSSTSPP